MTGNSRKTLYMTLGVLVGMLTLAFYSPVLYDTFCKVTGFGGTTQVAVERPEAVLDRSVRVRPGRKYRSRRRAGVYRT